MAGWSCEHRPNFYYYTSSSRCVCFVSASESLFSRRSVRVEWKKSFRSHDSSLNGGRKSLFARHKFVENDSGRQGAGRCCCWARANFNGFLIRWEQLMADLL
jgi:hypothetical protein